MTQWHSVIYKIELIDISPSVAACYGATLIYNTEIHLLSSAADAATAREIVGVTRWQGVNVVS